MEVLLPLPVALPLAAAGVSMLFAKHAALQRVLSLLALLGVLVCSIALLVVVDRDGTQVVQAGGWAAPAGISLVADRLSALLLMVSAAVLLAVLVYAIGQGVADGSRHGPLAVFHPCYLVLAAGIALAFLTGDLFNLFVAFEVFLVASYVLLTLGGGKEQVRAGMTYVVVSLLASVLFVTVVGLVYAATGTVNMADAAERLQDVPDGVRVGPGADAARRLRHQGGPVPAVLVAARQLPDGAVAGDRRCSPACSQGRRLRVIRTQTCMFPGEEVIARCCSSSPSLTMVVGILGAIVQDDVKRVLSFTIVSHIGYMLLGLGLLLDAGPGRAVLYTVHHIVVQTRCSSWPG
jgi:multicomponent Na+:H+ antiporter subunit D